MGRNSLLYVISSTVQKLSALLLLPIYTRLLTPEDYGYFNLLVTLALLVGVAALSGLDHAVVRYCTPATASPAVAGAPGSARAFTAAVIWVGGASATLAVGLGLATPVFGQLIAPGLDPQAPIVLAVCVAGFQPLTLLYLALLQAQQRAAEFAVCSLAYFVCNGALTVLLLWRAESSIAAAMTAMLVTNGAFAIYAVIQSTRRGSLTTAVTLHDVRTVLSYGAPMLPHALNLQATALSTRVIISHIVGVAAAGMFTIGMYAVSFIDAVQTALHRAFLPWFFQNVDSRPPGWERAARASVESFVWVNVCISSLVALFADEILTLLAGSSYSQAAAVVPVLALSMMAKACYYPQLSVLLHDAAGTRKVFMVSGAGSLIGIAATVALALTWGLWGAAIAQVIQRVSITAAITYMARGQDFTLIRWRRVLLSQSLAVGAILTALAVDQWGLPTSQPVAFVLKAAVASVVLALAYYFDPHTRTFTRKVLQRGIA